MTASSTPATPVPNNSIVEQEAAKAAAAALAEAHALIASLQAERIAADARHADLSAKLAAAALGTVKPQSEQAKFTPQQPTPSSNIDYVQQLKDKLNEVKSTFVWPSATRGLITAAVLITLGCGVAMGGAALASFFTAGAMSMAWPVFIQWIVATCAWAVAIYFGGKAMMWVGSYFLQKRVDDDIAKVRDGLSRMTTSPPKYVQEVRVVV